MQLEAELHRTDEQLQRRIEQSETSTEELKASNEELQAINEELRSTTEELETSKEELQSINEELITVNQELKAKVEETGKINDDLQNLIASTDIATVFVDRGLRIKRFTPRARQIFNIIASDIGRSLLDITHRLDYDAAGRRRGAGLPDAAHRSSARCATHDGRWYLARVLPYRTTEDRIDGAVLTFVDITARREAEEQLHAERAAAAHGGREHPRLRHHHASTPKASSPTWNSGAERIFGYSRARGARPAERAHLHPRRPRRRRRRGGDARGAREDGRAEDDRWHLRKDGSRVFCSGIMTPLREGGELRGYAKIARDLTGSRRTEREREALLRKETAGRAEAHAASVLKDEFLAVMSHELKNPLNLIHLNAELLARLPEAQVAAVGGARRRRHQADGAVAGADHRRPARPVARQHRQAVAGPRGGRLGRHRHRHRRARWPRRRRRGMWRSPPTCRPSRW